MRIIAISVVPVQSHGDQDALTAYLEDEIHAVDSDARVSVGCSHDGVTIEVAVGESRHADGVEETLRRALPDPVIHTPRTVN